MPIREPARVEAQRLSDAGAIPNNPRLPLMVYRGALRDEDDPAAAFERAFAANGWTGSWRNGIYPYHHFHSTAHEVLGIAQGEASVQFGGEGGPIIHVSAGDAVVLPAGTGHKRIVASPDLLVVGAYPEGQLHDLCTGKSDERERAVENIARVPTPDSDPLFGTDGPLTDNWNAT